MPYASQQLIDQGNDTLATGTTQAKKTFIRTHPVLPPSGGIKTAAVGGPNARFADVVTLDYSKLKIGAAADSLMFIRLRANEKNEVGALTFSMKSPADLPTTAARDFEAQQNLRGTLTNISVMPWGMVFGLRDATGQWSMTWVKNAFVMYHRIQTVTTKRFFRKDRQTTVQRGEIRAPRTYDADGNFTVGVGNTTEQAINHCVCLGYQDFFPGTGQAQLYDQNQIQVF